MRARTERSGEVVVIVPSLGGYQAVEPAQIPTETRECPFTGCFFESAHQKLSKAHTSFDISEHRLDGRLAQSVDCAAGGGA